MMMMMMIWNLGNQTLVRWRHLSVVIEQNVSHSDWS